MDKSGFYNRDCMDAMREFPDKFFDLAIVDPPYGIGISSNPVRQAHDKKDGTTTYQAENTSRSFSEYHRTRLYGAAITSHFLQRKT